MPISRLKDKDNVFLIPFAIVNWHRGDENIGIPKTKEEIEEVMKELFKLL